MGRKISDKSRMKQGRGTGDLETYIPFHFVHDFPGTGTKHKFQSLVMDRKRHALSTIEMYLILFVEMASNVYDSKEQFNMDLETTQAIAEQLNITHPRDVGESEDKILTLDLLIIYKDGSRRAVSVKSLKDLKDPRVIEKLEIERIWCCINGIQWSIFTDQDIPPFLKDNVKRIYENRVLEDSSKYSELLKPFSKTLQNVSWKDKTFEEVMRAAASQHKITVGRAKKMFHHLCCKRLIAYNFHNHFSTNMRFSEFKFTTDDGNTR